MYARYSDSWKSRALTLIEVITALALLSTLLVGMLVAFKKNAEQIRAGLAVREVVAGVDELLLSWAQQGTYPPAEGTGRLPGVDGFTWRTRIVSRQVRNTLALDIVRLEVRAEHASATDAPIVAIELPVPAEVQRDDGGISGRLPTPPRRLRPGNVGVEALRAICVQTCLHRHEVGGGQTWLR
jgi:hypothetical protein